MVTKYDEITNSEDIGVVLGCEQRGTAMAIDLSAHDNEGPEPGTTWRCARCGRDWEQRGSEWVEVANERGSAHCGGCCASVPVAPRPRLSLDCPTCGARNALSRKEAARGYQCRACADLLEGVG